MHIEGVLTGSLDIAHFAFERVRTAVGFRFFRFFRFFRRSRFLRFVSFGDFSHLFRVLLPVTMTFEHFWAITVDVAKFAMELSWGRVGGGSLGHFGEMFLSLQVQFEDIGSGRRNAAEVAAEFGGGPVGPVLGVRRPAFLEIGHFGEMLLTVDVGVVGVLAITRDGTYFAAYSHRSVALFFLLDFVRVLLSLHVTLERKRGAEVDLAYFASEISLGRYVFAFLPRRGQSLGFARWQIGDVGERLEGLRTAA